MHFAVLLVSIFIMMMAYWWLDTRCGAIAQDIGSAEKTLAKLDADLERETVKWNELKTPERLESALSQHGLNMHNPAPEQVIKMDAEGRLIPGQMSVARAQRRNTGTLSRTVQDTATRRLVAPMRTTRRMVR